MDALNLIAEGSREDGGEQLKKASIGTSFKL